MKHSGLFAVLAMAFGANVALAVPVNDPCPPGWILKPTRSDPNRKVCVKAQEVKPQLPVNDPETGPQGPGAGGPHPHDPLPPHPRPVGPAVTNPVQPHLPRDPGDGSGAAPGNPANPGGAGGMACKPGPRPKNLSCGPGMEWVDLDPSPKMCWVCRPKPSSAD